MFNSQFFFFHTVKVYSKSGTLISILILISGDGKLEAGTHMCGLAGSEDGRGAEFLVVVGSGCIFSWSSSQGSSPSYSVPMGHNRPLMRSQFQTLQHPSAKTPFPLTKDNEGFGF